MPTVTVAYVDSDGVERSHAVGKEPVVVGRATDCGIRSNDQLVSRNHAKLWVDQHGALFIQDLGSANGVFVGPNRVQISAIALGMVVVVGSLRFRRLPGSSPSASRPAAMVPQAAARPTMALLTPPGTQAAPAPAAQPGAEAHAMLVHLLEIERKARVIAEEERDAYGTRVAELYRELAAANARVVELLEQVSEPSASTAADRFVPRHR